MYTKSAADLRHYITHIHQLECIIYEQVVAAKSTFITDDNAQLKMTVTGCRNGKDLSILLFCRAFSRRLLSAFFVFMLLLPYNMGASFRVEE